MMVVTTKTKLQNNTKCPLQKLSSSTTLKFQIFLLIQSMYGNIVTNDTPENKYRSFLF